MASSSSSSVELRYQVFLSFRGEDTRHRFTSHLLKALKDRGINIFFDEEKLEKGEELTSALLKAITASKISIIVLSKDYASSKSCLTELTKIMECKDSPAGQIVLPIFYQVEPSHVRHPDDEDESPFKESFHHHLINKPQEVHRWKASFTQVGKLKGWHIHGDRSETKHIEDIVKVVLEKLGSTSASVSEDLVGIDDHIRKLMQLIDQEGTRVIGIWGMSGIGKTTLAEAVYNKIVSGSKFGAHHFLLNVREKSDKNGMQSLQSELLSKLLQEKIEIDTPTVGSVVIQDRLHNIRALVVLDDVCNSDQIDGLGVKHFGPVCKIIVTSTDRQVLENIGVDELHKVEELNENDSLKLFCKFAFKQDNPIANFQDLSMKFVSYAGGHPLALKVLGVALYQKTRNVWESALDKLKEYPEKHIFGPLKIGFDKLGRLEQNIFLDVACFFTGECQDYVTALLEGFYKGARYGITSLLDKCLVDVRSDRLWMHDLLQEMGRDIVRLESEDPGQRSRLWSAEDVYQVFKYNKGTKSIKGIILDMSQLEALQICHPIFEKMVNLMFIQFYCKDSSGNKLLLANQDLNNLPDGLRYFRWDYYPLKSLPSDFNPHKLVELCFFNSNIEQLWDEDLEFVNLRKMDLPLCKNIRKLPSLSRAIKLESLHCWGCTSLTELPCMTQLKSLKLLSLSDCPINKFPEIPTNLEELHLDGTQIEEVPSIIGSAIGEELPSSVSRLQSLKKLNVRGCKSLKSISGLSPCIDNIYATNCTSLERVSFTHDDYQRELTDGGFAFTNCFNLNQDACNNIFAACLMSKLQSRVKQLAKELKENNLNVPNDEEEPNEVVYYFPGSEIFDKFENQSRNSSITVKLANSAKSTRFLCFALCVVFDFKHFREFDFCLYDIECKYQLKDIDGVNQNFEGYWFVEYKKPMRLECSNEHVLFLFRDDMVHKDMNYKEASFDFHVGCDYINVKMKKHKGEKRKLEKCGVHVFYVDAETFTISDAGSSIDFGSDEGNRSSSNTNIISPNSMVSQIVHSLGRLTIEEDANGENGHGEDPAATISKLNPKRSFGSDDEEDHEPCKRVKLFHE